MAFFHMWWKAILLLISACQLCGGVPVTANCKVNVQYTAVVFGLAILKTLASLFKVQPFTLVCNVALATPVLILKGVAYPHVQIFDELNS